MGLSSSQARLLTLTARQHTLEYEAQRLQAQKLQLSNESDRAYSEYMAKLDATKMQYKVVDNSTGAIRYDDATFNKLQSTGKYMFKVGNTFCKDWSEIKSAMKSQHGVDITADGGNSYSILTALISEGYVVLLEIADDAEYGYSYDVDADGNGTGMIKYTDPTDSNRWYKYSSKSSVYVDQDGGRHNYETGESYDKMVYKVFKDSSVSTSTTVQEVSDEAGLKKAEAEYEADMNRINHKDAKYDNDLSQLETERSAIKQEIDTLKQVAKDNVDRTFKLFG